MKTTLLFACLAVSSAFAVTSPKFDGTKFLGNPLLDHHFTADPTAVVYKGRLYVYGTNDHQQYENPNAENKNTYEKIKTLTIMSTADMVNWTYHGEIPVSTIAPWIINSWAPSIVSRKEGDGKTHFYLYFSNSGCGTAVLTATDPIGPWTSPLSKSLVDQQSTNTKKCKVPFDPGAAIAPDGTGVTGAITGAASSAVKVSQAAKAWDSGTFKSGYQSMKYHYNKHVVSEGLTKGNNVLKYTQDAVSFANRNSSVLKYTYNYNYGNASWNLTYSTGQGGMFTSAGKILTFWYRGI